MFNIPKQLTPSPQHPIMSTELPPCKGPKLKRFEHHNRPIEWLERLGAGGDGDAGSVAKAYVFRARIEGQEYAVKVVSQQRARSQSTAGVPSIPSCFPYMLEG